MMPKPPPLGRRRHPWQAIVVLELGDEARHTPDVFANARLRDPGSGVYIGRIVAVPDHWDDGKGLFTAELVCTYRTATRAFPHGLIPDPTGATP